MNDFSEIQRSVECALQMPATFYDAPTSPGAVAAAATAVAPTAQ
jgi:hypothetical protein